MSGTGDSGWVVEKPFHVHVLSDGAYLVCEPNKLSQTYPTVSIWFETEALQQHTWERRTEAVEELESENIRYIK